MTFPFPTFCVNAVLPSISYRTSNSSTTNTSTYTFSGQDIGTAASSRMVVVAAHSRSSASRTLNTVTIGGVSATEAIQLQSGTNQLAIFYASVPTGATGDIVLTYSGTILRAAIGVWAVYDLQSTTPTDTGSSTAASPSPNIDVSAYGVMVACSVVQDGSTTRTATWTGVSEQYDNRVETQINCSGGDYTAGGTAEVNRTVTATLSGGASPIGLSAAWR